jgi:hypothetical protein
MKGFFGLRPIATGTFIAAALTGAAFGIAIFGFGNLYYASVFIPFGMLACLAIAWFSFLRDDGLIRSLPEEGNPQVDPMPPGASRAADLAGASGFGSIGKDGGVDLSLFAPPDGPVVKRRPVDNPREAGGGVTERAALVWAAVELGVLATVLYTAAGIGASFYH